MLQSSFVSRVSSVAKTEVASSGPSLPEGFRKGVLAEMHQSLLSAEDTKVQEPSLERGALSRNFQDQKLDPERGHVSILPGVDIPSRDAIINKPIQDLRSALDDAFKNICAHVEPVLPYLKSFVFHGTSEQGARNFLGGESPRDDRLWVGHVGYLAPTIGLVTRDLLNSIEVAAGFSGGGAGELNGSLLIITPPEEIARRKFSQLMKFIIEDDGYLGPYLDRDNPRGAFGERVDIGYRFKEPGALKDQIVDLINWRESPYNTIEPGLPIDNADIRAKFLKEARALLVLGTMLSEPSRRALASEPLFSPELINEAKKGFVELPDGTMIDKRSSKQWTIVIDDRVHIIPTDPDKFGSYIGQRFDEVTEDAAKLLKIRFPDNYIPPSSLVEVVLKWGNKVKYAGQDSQKIMLDFLEQYAERLNVSQAEPAG